MHDNILNDRTTESMTEKETASTDTITQTRRVTTESSMLSSLSSLESSPKPVTSAFQKTPSTQKNDTVTKNIIPIFGAAIFLLLICVILIVCHLKR